MLFQVKDDDMNHDHLCPPGLKGDAANCLTCILLRKARDEEWAKMAAMSEALLRIATRRDTKALGT